MTFRTVIYYQGKIYKGKWTKGTREDLETHSELMELLYDREDVQKLTLDTESGGKLHFHSKILESAVIELEVQ